LNVAKVQGEAVPHSVVQTPGDVLHLDENGKVVESQLLL
jgi:hypothetical protein